MSESLPGHFYFDGLVFASVMGLIFVLEKCFPARKNQPVFSHSFFQDTFWFFLGLVSRYLAVVIFAGKLAAYFHFPVPASVSGIPHGARFILAILVADFLAWFQHRLKHSVPFLWAFHEAHHNQIKLNTMTASRIHFVDFLTVEFCLHAPLFILGVEASYIAAYSFFMTWQIRAYHANIKSHMGFLRFIFVTPQSHRIHHSIENRHQDRNYGVLFSFWDRLFGTQHEDFLEYPAVGVKFPAMPVEDQSSLSSMIRTPFLQLIYPFVFIGQAMGRGCALKRNAR